MKSFRVFAIWLFMNVCLYTSAQNISVDSFRLLPNDLTANTYGTMERDQNGEVAALIKVVTLETGFVFDGGMLGIVKTIQKEGEIWIYVPFGLQRITITHRRFGVLRDYYFEIPIEKGRTYEMKLSTGVVRTVIEDNASAQFVTFIVEPKNAMITIDNISYPLSTDGTMRQLMAGGTHTYRVDAPGYFPENGTFQVVNGELNMTVELKSMHGTVHLECPMVDADLYVNNEFVGKGSWTGNLAPAMYQVEARHEGYRNSSVSFALQVQEERVITVPAPEAIYGSLSFSSTPTNASVYIDGALAGVTPFKKDDLHVGTHSIEFRMDSWNDYKTNVVVEENITKDVNVTLNNDFTAKIKSTPGGAMLSINGSLKGVTPLNYNLKPGYYELSVSKAEYESFKKRVYLSPQSPEVNLVLKGHRFQPSQFYIAAFRQFGKGASYGGQVGFYLGNVNFEVGYTKPSFDNSTVYWVSLEGTNQNQKDTIRSVYDYSSRMSASLGYGIKVAKYFRVTPQLGLGLSVINEIETNGVVINLKTSEGSTTYRNGLHTTHLLDGIATLRIEVSPIRHVSLFASPTYSISWKQGEIAETLDTYTTLIDQWHPKWAIKAGIEIYF